MTRALAVVLLGCTSSDHPSDTSAEDHSGTPETCSAGSTSAPSSP